MKKKGGCALAGCAAFMGLLALAGLVIVGLFSPEPATGPPVFPPSEEAEVEPAEPGRSVVTDPDSFHLTFRFRDPEGGMRRFSCVIRRPDLERERAGFGYVESERDEELNRTLREVLAREAAARGVERYFKIEVYGEGSFRWTWSHPGGTDPEVVERIQSFHAWLEKDARPAFRTLEERYYRERGLRLEGNTIKVDYEPLVHNATEPLADCFAALRAVDGRRSGMPLGLFLTFFQDLRYEIPQNVDEEGRETLGFRVPTAVLVEGAGDCDSKAAAFCSLWRQVPGRVILILVPGHALVGVEGKPGPGQAAVRLGNRYFILCEVAGPGRLRPGETKISGSFEYILIEPA